MWTFPQYKQAESNSFKNEIVFPDPKYYMIGITILCPEFVSKENYETVPEDVSKKSLMSVASKFKQRTGSKTKNSFILISDRQPTSSAYNTF